MRLTLPETTIHLWLAFPDQIRDEALLARYVDILNADEKKRWQRFHFAKHRHQFLVARALVRSTLSLYADIKPADWQFVFNPYGKPEIAPTLGLPALRFNLAHTDGLIICGVVWKHALGVDVENVQKKHETLKIAEHVFSKQEVADLISLPEAEQTERFYRYWTLKEAYIKAKGIGLALPLDQFSFIFSENNAIEIGFDPRLDDNPSNWLFWQLKPSMQHMVALALQAESVTSFDIITKTVIPLQPISH